MKIDLCKLLGVEEGEEFKIKLFGVIEKYRFKNGKLERYDNAYIDKWGKSRISVNDILESEIIKLPKKKKFSDDELCIFDEKPKKSEEMWDNVICSDFIELNCYNHLFNSIKWEDEEPIRIDDYAER